MSQNEGVKLEFLINGSDFDGAGEASSKIKRVLQQIGIPSETIRRIAISSYEAEMNLIIHSVRGRMYVEIFPNRTEITTEDEGPGIADVNLALKEGFSTAPDYVREMGFGAGMGLPNMMRCSDEFDITSELGVGTRIHMIIRH